MKTEYAIYVLVVGLMAASIFVYISASRSFVALDQAKDLLKKGALLLDVRTPAEYKAGHIESARNIPLQELSKRSNELGVKDKAILVYCHSGVRSHRAMKWLKAQGYSKVYNLGGMHRWKKSH